jgi:hypothetical protein
MEFHDIHLISFDFKHKRHKCVHSFDSVSNAFILFHVCFQGGQFAFNHIAQCLVNNPEHWGHAAHFVMSPYNMMLGTPENGRPPLKLWIQRSSKGLSVHTYRQTYDYVHANTIHAFSIFGLECLSALRVVFDYSLHSSLLRNFLRITCFVWQAPSWQFSCSSSSAVSPLSMRTLFWRHTPYVYI